ncbi:MAG: hypothetical protein QM532_03135 [Cyanobium sp. MAG06]|nr:hypothetical protein [Cyanobium sp. MAG06]
MRVTIYTIFILGLIVFLYTMYSNYTTAIAVQNNGLLSEDYIINNNGLITCNESKRENIIKKNTNVLYIQGLSNYEGRNKTLFKNICEGGYNLYNFKKEYYLEDYDAHKELINKINSLLRNNKDKDFAILAHSYGGVLTQSLDPLYINNIKKIITAATPHYIPFGFGDKNLGQINYNDNLYTNVKYISIGYYLDMTTPFIFSKKIGATHYNV